ncbi:hypothetical protein VTK26DRAFT_2419 [Humicola hyalothermophila]
MTRYPTDEGCGSTTLCVNASIHADAFVLNKSVCNGHPGDATTPPDAKIAPIMQPNYSFLRLDSNLLHSDVLPHTNLQNATPWSTNPRLVDLGQGGVVRSNREGVYVNWLLPRCCRHGVAATPSASAALAEQRRGEGRAVPSQAGPDDYSSPEFRQPPNRWYVLRWLDMNATTTVPNSKDGVEMVGGVWVIESDRLRNIDDPVLLTADLQVDVSPFITHGRANGSAAETDISIGEQGDVFLGYKADYINWTEDQTAARADLGVATAANPLFYDYQPHCGNVFSVLDPLECTINGKPGRLSSAVVTYLVVGMYSDPAIDPLNQGEDTLTRLARLRKLDIAPADGPPWVPDVQQWLDSTGPMKFALHGEVLRVQWNADQAPTKIPANDAAHCLAGSMPVAVGTTPMDALLAYLGAHQETELERDLFALAPLLRAQNDGVQAQRVATDELQSWGFSRQSGGVHWHFQGEAHQATLEPSPDEVRSLAQLNDVQRLGDAAARQLAQVRWNVFSCWWKYASLPADARAKAQYPLDDLGRQFSNLQALVAGARQLVGSLSQDRTKFRQLPKPGVHPSFSQRRDPCVLVGGIKAGWPDDFLGPLPAVVGPQNPSSSLVSDDDGGNDGIRASYARFLPEGLEPGARERVLELLGPRPFGDGDKDITDWDGTQPWFPLFAEWEVEYFHVKWDDWQLCNERKGQPDAEQWKLGVKPGVDLAHEAVKDTRTLAGRILLMPQPNFSLQAAISDLFTNADPKLIDKYLPDPAAQKRVQSQAFTLPFLSASLDGFTDQLLTLARGTHIKPNARIPVTGSGPSDLVPLPDAEIGPFGPTELAMIGASSELTPFGTLVPLANLGEAADASGPVAFKPCTHGQFRFTKLNIIDRFGQAICAIDPRYGRGDAQQAIYPCLSSFMAPGQRADDGQPNVVDPSPQPGHNESAQVPPAINQPSRLNCCFVTHDISESAPYWRPATEWENPVWGWVVLNYVDYGIQLFRSDGTFYREVRIAAPTAPGPRSRSAKWLPFDPPAPSTGADTAQLDRLLALLMAPDPTYLLAFLDMVSKALESSPTTSPQAYSAFLNSTVGRPLALTNAAWSLELAADAKTDQSSLDGHETKQQPTGLLDNGTAAEVYRFPLKLGDTDRAHDGLVGYFDTLANPQPGDELDLSAIYTYYYDTDAGTTATPLNPIGPANFPTLTAFWLDPTTMPSTNPPASPGDTQIAAATYTRAWNAHLRAFGVIIDPFAPITCYTGGVQPIGSLSLPGWTWQSALHKMTAFFRLGPLLVAHDVQQDWDADGPGRALGPSYTLSPPDKDATVPGSGVGVPSLDVAQWAWLQPFFAEEGEKQEDGGGGSGDDGDGEHAVGDHGNSKGEKGKDREEKVGGKEMEGGKQDIPGGETKYLALGLAEVGDQPGYERGPYTAIEGFLQLKEPIMSSEAPTPSLPSA